VKAGRGSQYGITWLQDLCFSCADKNGSDDIQDMEGVDGAGLVQFDDCWSCGFITFFYFGVQNSSP
jgi:hypothetical protein